MLVDWYVTIYVHIYQDRTSILTPFCVYTRIGLVPAPPPENPCLADGDTFRADSSPLFPRGFNMDKHTGGKGHPPT